MVRQNEWRRPGTKRLRGFSLVELLVAAGAIMILIGLVMPSIGGMMLRSRQTQDLAQLQQNEHAATAYINDWKDVFPLANKNAQRCSSLWYQALVRGGQLDGDLSVEPYAVAAADPFGVKRYGSVRFVQSVCMTYDIEHMTKGRTVATQFQAARPVRAGDVVYPSLKGWMLMGHLRPLDPETYFCCGRGVVPVPVGMMDGSCAIQDRTTYLWHGDSIVVVDEIGVPVMSTWGGYASRDR